MITKSVLYDWGGFNVELFQLINGGSGDFLTSLAYLGNIAGDYWGMPLVFATLLLWANISTRYHKFTMAARLRWHARRLVAGFAFACVSIALLKVGFDLPRPMSVLGPHVHLIGAPADRYSLPSGHTAYAALAAVVMWPLLPKFLRPLLPAFVAWVGWSRIASGAHFPADVMAGSVIGMLSGWLAHLVVRPLPGEGNPLPQRIAFNRTLVQMQLAHAARDTQRAYLLLQDAHVLGQSLLWPHLLTHLWMLRVALSQRDWREIRAQIVRITLAPIGNITGRLPFGNTGNAMVSAFKPMPASQQFQANVREDNDQ